MKIAGMQKLSLLDYPGKMCCTVFTLGCNFRCPFCHNSSLVLNTSKTPLITEDEFFEYLKKRANVLEGVCVSGGEPLIHDDIEEFIKKIKSYGYLVKLDTNGSFPDKLISLVNKGLVDFVAMDVKSSIHGYPKASGIADVDIGSINKSIDFLIQSDIPYEFRTTVVRELHNDDDFKEISERLKGAGKYTLQSFVDSDYVIDSTLSPYSPDDLERFASYFKEKVKDVSTK